MRSVSKYEALIACQLTTGCSLLLDDRCPGDVESRRRISAAPRQGIHCRHRFDARDPGQRPLGVFREAGLVRRFRVPVLGQRRLERDQTIGHEPGVAVHDLAHGAEQERRAREQGQRDRDLAHDEGAAQPLAAATGRPAAAALDERLAQIAAHRLQRWRQTEQHAGQHGQQHRGHERRAIERRHERLRQLRRHGEAQPLHDVEAHRDPDHAAGQGEQHALGQQLAQHPHAAGAERRADRHLLRPLLRPRDQQVRHVRRRDRHPEQRDDDEQSDQLGVGRAREPVTGAPDEQVEIAIRFRVAALHPAPCGGQLRAGLLDRRAGPEPAEHEEAAVRTVGPVLEVRRRERVHVGRDHLEVFRHHADDRVRHAVDLDRLPEHRRVGEEA